jgi:hypothetical protein
MLLLLHFLFIYFFSLEEKSFWNVILITFFVQEFFDFLFACVFFFLDVVSPIWISDRREKKVLLGMTNFRAERERSVCVIFWVGLEVERAHSAWGREGCRSELEDPDTGEGEEWGGGGARFPSCVSATGCHVR